MMALHWFIDARKRLIVVTAEGPVSRADIDALLDAVTGAKAVPYRKLVDATAGSFAMGAVDLLAIGARVRSLHTGSVGAVALVLPGRLPRDDEPEDAPTLLAPHRYCRVGQEAASHVQERDGRHALARQPGSSGRLSGVLAHWRTIRPAAIS
jgi:hypothetical protein